MQRGLPHRKYDCTRCLARKYAELKKIRHCRTGKQQSVDDDEEDIGRLK
jgi:hypothetical protein